MCTGSAGKVPAHEFNINWASDMTSLCDNSSMLHYFTLAFMKSSASAAAAFVTQLVQPQADLHHQGVLGFCCC